MFLFAGGKNQSEVSQVFQFQCRPQDFRKTRKRSEIFKRYREEENASDSLKIAKNHVILILNSSWLVLSCEITNIYSVYLKKKGEGP